MKDIKKQKKETFIKSAKKNDGVESKKLAVDNFEDVKKLVELLQIHQVELEHQNEELRIAQEELEVSRNKYVNLFDFSPIPYFTLDINGVIKETNLSASNMLGIDRKKLISKLFSNYVPLLDREIFNSFIKNIFSSPVKQTCELEIMNKGKRILHVRLEGLLTEDALEQDITSQIAVIDLTGNKELEDSLNKINEELKTLNETKEKFFSIIAHDLRNPFQALLSSSKLLSTEIEKLSKEEIIFFSKGLHSKLVNLYHLLENLLNWSMMQRNLFKYKPVNLNCYDLVNEIIELSNEVALKKNISISNNVDTGTLVHADVDMLRSVVQNLIANAIKFNQADGRIIVSSIEKGGFVEVSVQDTGIGIAPEKTSGLFNFNSIFTKDGTAGEKGTGLGLPLCREFVESNGGKIWVESELGKGSKFTFTLQKTIS